MSIVLRRGGYTHVPAISAPPRRYVAAPCKALLFARSLFAYAATDLLLQVTLVDVDLTSHVVKSGPGAGGDFYKINKKGNVPTLIVAGALADGKDLVLTEGAVSLQYLADHGNDPSLVPRAGTAERYLLQNSLNFLASELQPAMAALFDSGMSEEIRAAAVKKLHKKLTWLADGELAGGAKAHLLGGSAPTIADMYAYMVLTWADFVSLDLAKDFPALAAYRTAMSKHAFVAQAAAAMAAAQKKPEGEAASATA